MRVVGSADANVVPLFSLLGTPPNGITPPYRGTPPDGGTPPENSPVIRPAEPRDPSYTGPLYADREGGSLPTEWSL